MGDVIADANEKSWQLQECRDEVVACFVAEALIHRLSDLSSLELFIITVSKVIHSKLQARNMLILLVRIFTKCSMRPAQLRSNESVYSCVRFET